MSIGDVEIEFIKESNRIEGINRKPTKEETKEFLRFMNLRVVTIDDLIRFVNIYQPNAELRDKHGLDVRVGSYYPPRGCPAIRNELIDILKNARADNSFETHIAYEKLHPFTDGNGRSGRMLWAWQEQDLSLGFLHKFYYQTLRKATP